MRRSPAFVLVAVALTVVAGSLLSRVVNQPPAVASDAITPAERAATFRFAPSVAPADRAWILAAIASARPEARRLIGEVDGAVTITTAGTENAMGNAGSDGNGYRIWLNINRLDGTRKVDRPTTVLHELGHVVDFALIDDAQAAKLDAGIPQAASCEHFEGFDYGGCAPAEERLADTFAKWALGGAVSQVGAGYGIPMPASLEDWGQPLVALAASLPAA
jgi:hypothetical protein